jgi:hypothetical protein
MDHIEEERLRQMGRSGIGGAGPFSFDQRVAWEQGRTDAEWKKIWSTPLPTWSAPSAATPSNSSSSFGTAAYPTYRPINSNSTTEFPRTRGSAAQSPAKTAGRALHASSPAGEGWRSFPGGKGDARRQPNIDAVATFYVFAFLEAAAMALGAAYFLWGRVPHHALAVVSGMTVVWGYFRSITRQATVYWMLLPRMVMWGTAIAWTTLTVCSFLGDEIDQIWLAVSGCVVAALVLWNSCRAKRDLRSGVEVSNPQDSQADGAFFVFVFLEAVGLAFGAGYILWNQVPSIPYNAGPLLAAATLWAGYLAMARRQQTINWLLLPRMVMWGGAIAWAMSFSNTREVLPLDLGWKVFGACLGAVLILWNGRLAKRKLCLAVR